MSSLQIFSNQQFGEIRTITEGEKVLFCGNDIAKALGYSNSRDALARHCRAVVKHDTPISGKIQGINFIPEGDVYRLITHSKLPAAEKFEQWVFEDVLPSIRKHGMYAADEILNNPDLLIGIAQKLKEERALRTKAERQIAHDKPKVFFADAVVASETSILVGDLAKLMKQNGVNIGQKRLFEWLRAQGWLVKRKGEEHNMPTQKAMEQGLFEIKETTMIHSDGHTSINKTSKVTGRGQVYFLNKFLQEETCNVVEAKAQG